MCTTRTWGRGAASIRCDFPLSYGRGQSRYRVQALAKVPYRFFGDGVLTMIQHPQLIFRRRKPPENQRAIRSLQGLIQRPLDGLQDFVGAIHPVSSVARDLAQQASLGQFFYIALGHLVVAQV